MSASSPPDFDLREQAARIDRAQAETRKFVAEQNKLVEEALKLAAERMKLERDRGVAPWLAVGAVAGGILTAATLLLRILGVL